MPGSPISWPKQWAKETTTRLRAPTLPGSVRDFWGPNFTILSVEDLMNVESPTNRGD